MIKRIMKALVPVLVFMGTFLGISAMTDRNNGYLTSRMADAALPVVYLQKDGADIDELFGYKGQMEEESIRGNIMPLSRDMMVPMTVRTYQSHVEGISYEVRTMDTMRLMEAAQVADYSEKDGVISTQLHLGNLLQPNVEYRLILILTCDGEEVRYYSRLFLAEDCYVDESIEFVRSFHQKALDKQELSSLAPYMEPSKEGDNTTLQKVTIHSSLKQVGWADMEGQVLKEPIPAIQEISSSYNTIVLNYVFAATGENGETEFYNVEEYFRVRYSTSSNTMQLLDYQRSMDEIFRGSESNFTKTGIQMGIRDPELSYFSSESGRNIGFVQEGDLWNYNGNTNQLSLVFSFRGIEGINDRENHPEHDIRIVKMDENGSMDFVVFGYMNRGDHEGYTGIGVYHYDAVANTVQEELFVESPFAYQVLKETWGRLFYVSGDGYFYMVAEDTLYRMNLLDGTVKAMKGEMKEEGFAAAADGRYIAWQDSGRDTITVTDLEGEKQWQVEGEAGAALYPIGFVESDFVYGIANEGSKGSSLIYKVVIVSQQGEVIKEYEKEGLFITNAYVDKISVVLERATKAGNYYMAADNDTIKSSEIEAAQSIQADTVYDDRKQTQVRLTLSQELPQKTLQLLTPKEVVAEERNYVSLEQGENQEHYYVYYGGAIMLCTDNISEAVRFADGIAGSVVGRYQQYIWRRGRDSSKTIEVEELPFDVNSLVAAQENQGDTLKSAMTGARVLDLTGCDLSQILYFVYQGSPVFSYDSAGQPMLVVGYDFYNILLYDFESRTTYREGLSDGQEIFEQAGNIFITYLME